MTFWYLATPYTRYPGGHEAAAVLAARYAARLMNAGVPVFSPIAHSHPIAGHLDPARRIEHEFWMNVDAPFMAAACGIIVVMETGWDQSQGVAEEIMRFTAAGKPVVYWEPGNGVPEGLTPPGAATR